MATTVSPITAEMKACIDACTTAHHVCLETLSRYLQPNGPQLDTERYQLLADCAEMCEMHANFMLSASPRSASIAAICAPLCDETAKSCEATGDPDFAACARACRKAAETCRRMADHRH
jgi:hypothetical protein